MKIVRAVLTTVLVVLYPLAIWIALTRFSARMVGLLILVMLVPIVVVRFRRAKREDLWAVLRIPLAILAVVLLGIVFDAPIFVLAMPVLINLVLLITFWSSLRAEHTIIERFARMKHGRDGDGAELSEAQVAHCRQVTKAWCGFFVLNAAAAAALAYFAPLSWWAAYTGGIAYGLMAAMFALEYIVRQARFRNYGRGLHDRLLSRIFPPHEPRSDAPAMNEQR
jgi:uncharacterized membrane protein